MKLQKEIIILWPVREIKYDFFSDNRVWDYAGDYFVHRLINNESSGKIVETKSGCGDKELSIQMECLQLLTTQLDEQRKYWEEQLEQQKMIQEEMAKKNLSLEKKIENLSENFCTKSEMEKEKQNFERKLRQSTEKAVKVKIELDAEKEMTQNLVKTRIELDQKVEEQSNEITELNGTVRDLMLHLQASQSIEGNSVSIISKIGISRLGDSRSCLNLFTKL
jgi:BRCA1-associated protein